MNITNEQFIVLVSAIECSAALDMPYQEAIEILEKNGWNGSDPFEVSGAQFATQKATNAMEILKILGSNG